MSNANVWPAVIKRSQSVSLDILELLIPTESAMKELSFDISKHCIATQPYKV